MLGIKYSYLKIINVDGNIKQYAPSKAFDNITCKIEVTIDIIIKLTYLNSM